MLNLFERMSLSNQYQLLKIVNPKESDFYDESIKALELGATFFYPEPNLFYEVEMSEEDQKLIVEILYFYDRLYEYKNKNPQASEISNHIYGSFRGFDWNEQKESRYLALTRFLLPKHPQLIKEAGDCNTHSPRLDVYKRILKKWNELEGLKKYGTGADCGKEFLDSLNYGSYERI